MRGPTARGIHHHGSGETFTAGQGHTSDLITRTRDGYDWRVLADVYAVTQGGLRQRLQQAWGTHLRHIGKQQGPVYWHVGS